MATHPDSNLKSGDSFKDCAQCPEMIVIPAGKFTMGSAKGKKREQPVRQVVIPNFLPVGRHEITFDEWDACHADGGCAKLPFDRGWGRGKRPVINVLATDIDEYLKWMSKKTAHVYRLPSEAEWEYAARAGSESAYYWGDEMIQGKANCRECGSEWSGEKTAPVGMFEPNPWGLFDVHGNVLELVADCWFDSHESAPKDALPRRAIDCRSKVVKGGAWYYLPNLARSAARARNDTRVFSYFIGFRAFREIE